MKRTLSLVLSLVMILGIFSSMPITVNAASTSDLTFRLNSDGESYSVTDCNEKATGSLVIPATYTSKPITSIGNYAFFGCENLTSITIPDSVTSIGEGAFRGCTSLTSITIPDSVTSIGDWVFYDCSSLTSITIPDSVTSIGDSAFGGCKSLKSVTIPDSVTSIGNWAFYDCSSFQSITIPDSVTSIGNNAFSSCKSLASITIGNGVTSIGEQAFAWCYNLASIYITDVANWCNIDFVDSYSNPLYYAKNLYINGELATDIVIPDGVASIPEYGFSCENVTSITIPDSVTSIGNWAFYDCSSLKSVEIGNGVTSIGNNAFHLCTSLISITIGNGVTSIGEQAFTWCDNLASIYITDVAKWCNIDFKNSSSNPLLYAKNLYINGELATDIVIPDGVVSIPKYGFSCENVTSIAIPDSVTSIGDGALYNCTSLISITIPVSVKSIGDSAFSRCKSLNSITIPDSVTSIGRGAFSGCTSLTSIVIPDSVTSIGGSAFDSCRSITSITIPDSVTSIGNGAFRLCKSLTSITIPDSVTSIGNWAFESCTSLMLLTIPDSVTYIGDYICLDCTNLTAINVDDSNPNYASIDGVLFNKNKTHLIQYPKGKNYTEYVIPDGVASIGDGAFYKCTSLTSITIPDSVTYIGESAFSNCTQLKDVYYKGSVADQIGILFYNECLLNATWHYAKVSKPATPKVATTNEIGGVNVTWNKVAGATKYVVYRRQGGYNTWVNVGTTTGTTLLDKNVKSGIYYVYSVRAYNAAGKYSDFVSANTQTRKFMATPKLTTIYNHQNGLAIKWNAVAGITNGYRVYRRGAGSTYWTYLGTTKNLYFIDSQVKNKSGEYFRYTVIADGDYHSKFDTTGLYLRRLANPTLNSAVSSKSGITVKWGAVKGTTGYYVYRKTANSTWVRVGTVGGTNNTTFLDKTAKKGTTYTYTVKAVYGATTSAYNSGISCYDKY